VPNIKFKEPVSLDEFRKNPGRLYPASWLAATGVIKSYDGVGGWVRDGRLREPYVINRRPFWEGRDILDAIERSRRAPRQEPPVSDEPPVETAAAAGAGESVNENPGSSSTRAARGFVTSLKCGTAQAGRPH
jgi:hypothetical protein